MLWLHMCRRIALITCKVGMRPEVNITPSFQYFIGITSLMEFTKKKNLQRKDRCRDGEENDKR